MVERYRGGSLPAPAPEPALAEALDKTVLLADERVCALDFQSGIAAVFDYVRLVNGYVTDSAPWVLAKDPARAGDLDRVLYATAESLRALAVLLNPVMPKACAKLWTSLGAEARARPARGAARPGRRAVGPAAGRQPGPQGRGALPPAARRGAGACERRRAGPRRPCPCRCRWPTATPTWT